MEDTTSLCSIFRHVNLDQCLLTYPTIPRFMLFQLQIQKNPHGELTVHHKMLFKASILDHAWATFSVSTFWKTVRRWTFLKRHWINNLQLLRTRQIKVTFSNGAICHLRTIKWVNFWYQRREFHSSSAFQVCLNSGKKEDKQSSTGKISTVEQSICTHWCKFTQENKHNSHWKNSLPRWNQFIIMTTFSSNLPVYSRDNWWISTMPRRLTLIAWRK